MVNAPLTTAASAAPGPELALAPAYAGGERDWLVAALALDARLAEVALRPGDPALARLRVMWWEESVAALVAGTDGVDPLLTALAPGIRRRPERADRVAATTAAWDERVGPDPNEAATEALATARARLLLDGAEHADAERALAGRALWSDPAGDRARARDWLDRGLRRRWPRALRAQRLLAHAARMRARGTGERRIAAALLALAVTGR